MRRRSMADGLSSVSSVSSRWPSSMSMKMVLGAEEDRNRETRAKETREGTERTQIQGVTASSHSQSKGLKRYDDGVGRRMEHGWSTDGARLAMAGLFGRGEHRGWRAGAVLAGVGQCWLWCDAIAPSLGHLGGLDGLGWRCRLCPRLVCEELSNPAQFGESAIGMAKGGNERRFAFLPKHVDSA